MSEFFLELFSEEMPAILQKSASENLLKLFKENFKFKHHGLNMSMFSLKKIANKFQSVHTRDFIFLPLGLYSPSM